MKSLSAIITYLIKFRKRAYLYIFSHNTDFPYTIIIDILNFFLLLYNSVIIITVLVTKTLTTRRFCAVCKKTRALYITLLLPIIYSNVFKLTLQVHLKETTVCYHCQSLHNLSSLFPCSMWNRKTNPSYALSHSVSLFNLIYSFPFIWSMQWACCLVRMSLIM